MKKISDMTEGSPARHILTFAFPLIITNIGQQLYMIADASIVGRCVGVKALAAVGATDWLYFLILWTVVGLTQSISTYVSRYFGDRNFNAMNKAIAMCTLLCASIGAALTLAGLISASPMLELLNTPDDIIDNAEIYFNTLISGTLIVAAYNMAASVLRALGNSRAPLIAMGISAFINIGLDLLFILVLKMNIFGAALASVLAQLVSFIYCFVVLKRIGIVSLGKSTWIIDRKLMKSIISFGMPLALGYIVISLGGVILQSTVNLKGSAFVAGYTATNKVYGLLECSAISLGIAASTFLSQNYGAGKYKRVKEGIKTVSLIALILSGAISVISIALRNPLMELFLNANEKGGAEAQRIAVYYLIVLSLYLSILYLLHIFRNVLQAMEIASWSMLSGFAEFISRVAMSKIVIKYIGDNALFYAEPIAWFVALLIVFIPYFYYRKKLLE